MVKYEVGKPFPQNFAFGQDASFISTNESLFDLVLAMSRPTAHEKKTIKQEPIRYGCYYQEHVPVFIVDFRFQNLSFDATLNFTKVKEDKRKDWLKTEGNTIGIFVVDAQTNILHAMRMISVNLDFAMNIKNECKLQLQKHAEIAEVDSVINRIYRNSTNELINKIEMYNL